MPPGLAMVSVSERAWQAAEQATMPRYYLDLAEARKFQGKGETPWTPAVSVLLQLDVALDMLENEGYEGIFARHGACGAAARAGLRAMGFGLLAEPEYASNTVTAAWLPEGVEWSVFNRALLDRGLVLAGGQGKLTGQILRIGHLGAVAVDDVISAVETIEAVARELGLPVEAGAGSRAAREASREQVPAPA